jgi:hypothetical protein
VIVIGRGRVGGALVRAAVEHGMAVSVVTRKNGWEALTVVPGPILVTVRTSDLADVLPLIPTNRRRDVILIQNGMLSPWLADRGLGSFSRGVLYFAVPVRGAPIDVGGSSPFCGPQASAVVLWLQRVGVAAVETDAETFKGIEVEKLLWNCVFGLLCAASQEPVGRLCDARLPVIRALTTELLSVASANLGVTLAVDSVVDGMVAYSQSIPNYTGRISDWDFRNGWFVEAAKESGVDMPIHTEWAARVGR